MENQDEKSLEKRLYRVPCMGKVLDDTPLKGSVNNPLCPIPLMDLAREQGIEGLGSYESLNYNVDEGWVEIKVEATEEAHNWLASISLSLKQMVRDRGWKLDKEELRRRRVERLSGKE